jgi:hypothetical protein
MDINNFFIAKAPKAQKVIADLRTIKALEAQLTETDYQIIKCYEYKLADVFKMIQSGEINDAKTICALSRAFCKGF